MYTCSKTYSDIPFAHRQHKHEGHCSFIHGHNWSFKFTFGCKALNDKGFVVDFGELKFIKRWLDDKFDHAYVYNERDFESEALLIAFPKLFKACKVECCSAEGLAKQTFDFVAPLLKQHHGDRVQLLSVEILEDSKNTAEYRP
ncbi:MAG: 6-carboxytetrahydropterin synthase [Verrucomicrobia bacterium]|nr:6-carboxytetrahydropterin synthase [Verrucomicrobiota bacterium]